MKPSYVVWKTFIVQLNHNTVDSYFRNSIYMSTNYCVLVSNQMRRTCTVVVRFAALRDDYKIFIITTRIHFKVKYL